jgi:hypothetical protein
MSWSNLIDLYCYKWRVSHVEPCMLEKGVADLVSTMLGNARGREFLGEVVDIMQDKVGPLALCGMPPAMVNHIQLGRIAGEEHHVNPVPAEVMQQPRDFSVPIATIPDQQQGSLEMAVHLLDKCQDIVTGDIAGIYEAIAARSLLPPSFPQPVVPRPSHWDTPAP